MVGHRVDVRWGGVGEQGSSGLGLGERRSRRMDITAGLLSGLWGDALYLLAVGVGQECRGHTASVQVHA